jgi:hypothetical protein
VRIFSITGYQGTAALALARRKRFSGPFTSGLTPLDRRDDLQLAAAVRAVLQFQRTLQDLMDLTRQAGHAWTPEYSSLDQIRACSAHA